MSDNLRHWNKLCAPPTWALRPIAAGRLKGKTDINPQWRMMAMTDTFGPCGTGWKYTIDKLWLERGAPIKKSEEAHEEVAAFALVSVYYKDGEEWSAPVPGIGGSMFTEMEKNGPFNSDEAYKMAITDALSVAFKAIGVAANIYSGDRFDGSKYQREQRQAQQPATPPQEVTEPTTARLDLYNALGQVYHGNEAEMADALRSYSEFDGKDGSKKFLTIANLQHPTANEKLHKWFASTLKKLAEDSKKA